jgi:hypothetical protein
VQPKIFGLGGFWAWHAIFGLKVAKENKAMGKSLRPGRCITDESELLKDARPIFRQWSKSDGPGLKPTLHRGGITVHCDTHSQTSS